MIGDPESVAETAGLAMADLALAEATSRSRLIGAMTEVVAEHGYAGASVARVAAAARASRATFYQHFRNREHCFAAAYRAALREVDRTCESIGPGGSLDAVLGPLLEAADADPALARLLLLEAPAAPRRLRADHFRLLGEAERSVSSAARCALRLPPAALHGGLTAVVSAELSSEDGGPCIDLLPGLAAWLRCYRATPLNQGWDERSWSRLGRNVSAEAPPSPSTQPEPRRLPRGRSAVSRAVSAEDRRRRLIDATIAVVARKGYAAASVADIVAAARVTRGAFYSHFECKLDAFLAALVNTLQESIAAAAREYFLAERWPERVWNGLAALLGYVAEHPQAAQLGMLEVHAAGPHARRRADENRKAFGLFLADGYYQTEPAAELPRLCSDAIAGAIEAILRRELLLGRGHRAVELLPQCAYVALAPFLGAEAALETILVKSEAAPSAA